MRHIYQGSFCLFITFFSFSFAVDLFVPNFDPIILKNLNIEYEWFENLLEQNPIENDCLQIDAQLPQIEFAYNTISNFELATGAEAMKDLENIRKLMGSLEVALDQEYEEKIFNETQFTEELNNVQRELKKKIATQVLDSNLTSLEIIQWTNDMNETQYVSKISEEAYLLSIKKEILSTQINENSQNQALLIKDANETISKLTILLNHYFEIYYNTIKLNQEMILIFELNQYITSNHMTEFDTEKLEQSYSTMQKDFKDMYNQIQQIQKLYQKMKNLLTQMIKKIEQISDEKDIHLNQQTEINDLIQKYQMLSSIFQGIQQQEESNKTLSELIEKQEYIMNYQGVLENLDQMYTNQLIEIKNELKNLENNTYVYAIKRDTIEEINEQQQNLKKQLQQISEEYNIITEQIQELEKEKEKMALNYNKLQQEYIEINKDIEELELNISKVQAWLHNSLIQIQNYTDIKLAFQTKLEMFKKENKIEELKNAEHNIKIISEWLPEEQKKYIQYQQYEENLFQNKNNLNKKKEEIKNKLDKYQIQEESNKLQFYSFVESSSSFIYNHNPSELESLLYSSQKAMNELNKLKQGQNILIQEYQKLVNQKEYNSSVSTQFKNYLQIKGYDLYNRNNLPEYQQIIASNEFKQYQKSEELNFIKKQQELLQQSQIIDQLNEDIAAKEDEIQSITYSIDACVMVCSVVGHKSAGSQPTIIGSKLSLKPKDRASSRIAGYYKSIISFKENYIYQLPLVFAKSYGELEDKLSGKSLISKKDKIHEIIEKLPEQSWSSNKHIGKFYNNITTDIIIFIDPLQNNITTKIIVYEEIGSQISSSIIFLEPLEDETSNKKILSLINKISENHIQPLYYDIINQKQKLGLQDNVSSIVEIKWTNIIGSVFEGELEDEVSSTIVPPSKEILVSFKNYSGRIQDEKFIKQINQFNDHVSSKAISKHKNNEISMKENYVKQGIFITEKIYGIIKEAISIRNQGRIKNFVGSEIEGAKKDKVSSKAIFTKNDQMSEEIEKVLKDYKFIKNKSNFQDKINNKSKQFFIDKVSSKVYSIPNNQKHNETIWKKQDQVSSKAIKPKNKFVMKARYIPKDKISSQNYSQVKDIIHTDEYTKLTDFISANEHLKKISYYSSKTQNQFSDHYYIKIQREEKNDIYIYKNSSNFIDRISSRNPSKPKDSINQKMSPIIKDEISSKIHHPPQSIYKFLNKNNFIDKISSKINNLPSDKYAFKLKYDYIDKIQMKSKWQEKDKVSSKVHADLTPKFAIKSKDQFIDKVSSKVVNNAQPIIGVVISIDEMEDEVSSTINKITFTIPVSHKFYTGALVDEVAGETSYYRQFNNITSYISMYVPPGNNISTKIKIYQQMMNNISTHKIKYCELSNNISTHLIIFEAQGSSITTGITKFGEIEDNVSSKVEPGPQNKFDVKSKNKFTDWVSSKIEDHSKDYVSSRIHENYNDLISIRKQKDLNDKISIYEDIIKENRIGIKSIPPQIYSKYSGRQTIWERKNIYSGYLIKCDCEDDVSSIIEGDQPQDLYSIEDILHQKDIFSQKKEINLQNLWGVKFAGELKDKISSKAIHGDIDNISTNKNIFRKNIIGSVISFEDFEDDVSSKIKNYPEITVSFRDYSGKIMDYKEIKIKNNFNDWVSSKVPPYVPTDYKYIKSKFTQKDKVIVITSAKDYKNITTDIKFYSQLQNNISTHKTQYAFTNNISTSIIIYEKVGTLISTAIVQYSLPEDNVSSIIEDKSTSIISSIISWEDFEDEVSSKIYDSEEDEVHSIIDGTKDDIISEENLTECYDRSAFKTQIQLINKMNIHSYHNFTNIILTLTNFKNVNNISTKHTNPEQPNNITSQIIDYYGMRDNISTAIAIYQFPNQNNISTHCTPYKQQDNITTSLIKYAPMNINNISTKIIIYEQQGNEITTGFWGDLSNQFSHRHYDGGIDEDEICSETTYKPYRNISSDIIIYQNIETWMSTGFKLYYFEDLIATKTSKTKFFKNITTQIKFYEKIANNITTHLTDFTFQNNITTQITIFVPPPDYISTDIITYIPMEDEVHSKVNATLENIISSVISDLNLEDDVSSIIKQLPEDIISIDENLHLIDIIHQKVNISQKNITTRQSLVDYWLCDYVGEVFSYVAHNTTYNTPNLNKYSNNNNNLINTAKNLALLLKNITYQKTSFKTSHNVDQLLQLTNSYSINGFNIHYYTQLRELIKAVSTEIEYFYLVLAKQQSLYSKRTAFKNLIDNYSKQKDKCMVKNSKKTFLRKRIDV